MTPDEAGPHHPLTVLVPVSIGYYSCVSHACWL
jgi:hypothetical protein